MFLPGDGSNTSESSAAYMRAEFNAFPPAAARERFGIELLTHPSLAPAIVAVKCVRSDICGVLDDCFQWRQK
jgi:hypothetical protein